MVHMTLLLGTWIAVSRIIGFICLFIYYMVCIHVKSFSVTVKNHKCSLSMGFCCWLSTYSFYQYLLHWWRNIDDFVRYIRVIYKIQVLEWWTGGYSAIKIADLTIIPSFSEDC